MCYNLKPEPEFSNVKIGIETDEYEKKKRIFMRFPS